MLIGLCGGVWPLLAAAVATEFGPGAVGRVFALLTIFLPITHLAPFAVAKGQEVTGSYAPVLVALAAIAVIGGAACLLMRDRGKSAVALAGRAATDAASPAS
jgi:hypothetical protein